MHWGGGIMWIFWLLVIVLVIVLLKALLPVNDLADDRPKKALEILKQRYARGEIDDAEFEQRKHELEKN